MHQVRRLLILDDAMQGRIVLKRSKPIWQKAVSSWGGGRRVLTDDDDEENKIDAWRLVVCTYNHTVRIVVSIQV